MMKNFKETKNAENRILNIILKNKKESRERFYRWKKINVIRKYQFNPKSKNEGKIEMICTKYRRKVFEILN